MEHRRFFIDFTIQDLFEYCRRRIVGQDAELKKAVYMVYRYIENVAARAKTPAPRWLLTAPSGMGKTEFYRCLRDYFKLHGIPLPVLQIDLSQITETGFRGNNMNYIIETIYEAALSGSNTLPKGAAICFLDEADKKFTPSFDRHGSNINANIQSNLLTMIEGTVLSGTESHHSIDTSNTMFVLMGAFQTLRDKKQENAEALREIFKDDYDGDDDLFSDIKLEDMIPFGLIEELAGRLSMVVNFHRLSEEDMQRLIVDKAQTVGEEYGASIRLTPKCAKELAELGYGNLGIRTPINKLRELAVGALAERSFEGGFDPEHEEIVVIGKSRAEIRSKG